MLTWGNPSGTKSPLSWEIPWEMALAAETDTPLSLVLTYFILFPSFPYSTVKPVHSTWLYIISSSVRFIPIFS